MQAFVLAQSFGILSGEPSDLVLSESFHSTLISWVRRANMFDLRDTFNVVDLSDKSDLETTWKSWIKAEEAARIILALQLQDAQFSALFHHEPLLRQHLNKLPICCSESIFGATSACGWSDLIDASRPPAARATVKQAHGTRHIVVYASSPINAYASLAGIHASISEARSTAFGEDVASHLRRCLDLWRETWFPQGFESEGVSGWATIQWHQNYMSLYADFDLVERAVGRDGHSAKIDEDVKAISKWTLSAEGKHCAAHALLILKRLEPMPLSSESGMHVPLATFHAALVLYSHIRWSEKRTSTVSLDATELNASNFKDLPRVIGLNTLAYGSEIDVSVLSRLKDLLQRQGHWGLSTRFALIMEVLIDEMSGSSGTRWT